MTIWVAQIELGEFLFWLFVFEKTQTLEGLEEGMNLGRVRGRNRDLTKSKHIVCMCKIFK